MNYYCWRPQLLPRFALCRQNWAGVSFTEQPEGIWEYISGGCG